MKRLRPDQATVSSYPVEMYHFVMHNGSKVCGNFCKSFLKFVYLLTMGFIKGLWPVLAILVLLSYGVDCILCLIWHEIGMVLTFWTPFPTGRVL